MPHDPSKTWLDALALLEREESYLRLGAIAVMKRLTADNKDLVAPSAEVLQRALHQWEQDEPDLHKDVQTAAKELVATLTGQDPHQPGGPGRSR